MKGKLKNALLILLLILTILFAFLWIRVHYCADVRHDSLEKAYFIGGIVSGIFAFAAFGVALWSNVTSRKTNNLQRFENTLFNMLSLQQQIVSDLCYKEEYKDTVIEDAPNPANGRIQKEVLREKIIQGRDLFRFLFEEVEFHIDSRHFTTFRGYLHNKGLKAYDDSTIPSYFDHYFRHLYTIIKFIDKTSYLEFPEKYKYTSMVRATLSRYELIWLYYNCLSDVGKDKFKPLIEEYSILKNMRDDLLSLSKEAKDFLRDRNITTIQEVKDEGFTGKDYEFFLTKEKGNQDKYYIGAFYNKDNLHKGKKLVDDWDAFIKSKQKGNAE